MLEAKSQATLAIDYRSNVKFLTRRIAAETRGATVLESSTRPCLHWSITCSKITALPKRVKPWHTLSQLFVPISHADFHRRLKHRTLSLFHLASSPFRMGLGKSPRRVNPMRSSQVWLGAWLGQVPEAWLRRCGFPEYDSEPHSTKLHPQRWKTAGKDRSFRHFEVH